MLLLNGILVVLLVAFLYYAVILNRKLGSLRDSKGELEKVIVTFADATERANKSIHGFKSNADQSGRALQDTIDKARGLRDDLNFLIDKAESVANRLEGGIRAGRPQAPAAPSAPAAEAASREADVVIEPLAEPKAEPKPAARPAPAAAAEAPLDPKMVKKDKPQSKAERELLKALQSMR